MRPKILALLAVSSLALAGCSAAAPAPTPAETPSASAVSSEPRPTSIEDITLDMDPALKEETAFIYVAQRLASFHGAKKPDADELIESLYAFCDSGKPIGITGNEFVDDSLEQTAKTESCDKVKTD